MTPDAPLPCTVSPAIFDPEASGQEHWDASVLCRGCPWRAECLLEARATRDAIGVRAGFLFGVNNKGQGTGRFSTIRRPRVPLGPPKPCGTHAAFNRHKTAHEEPCAACRRAEHIYQSTRHRKRREHRLRLVTS